MENFSGIPKITHFSRADFEADSQFWSMTTDSSGVRYFGNNDGAIIFDGQGWKKVRLPNNSSVRSLLTTTDGEIYVGGYNELGTIKKDSLGGYFYSSLLENFKLGNQKLENLWQVHQFKDHIIYRAFNELVVLSGTSATHIPATDAFIHTGIVNGRFLVQDTGAGILEFNPETMQLRQLFSNESIGNNSIVGFFPEDKNLNLLRFFSRSGEIYSANIKTGEVQKILSVFNEGFRDEIISVVPHGDSFLLGTLGSKIVLLGPDGKIQRDPHAFSKLHDSSILNFFEEDDNLWVLLNNGLDYIEFNSPVSLLFDEASIYDILVEPDHIYLATNKGVYYSAYPPPGAIASFKFHKIPGLDGQAWSVQKLNGTIVLGHDKGLFLLRDQVPVRIGSESGFWKIIPIKDTPNSFLASNYNGLYLVTEEAGQWELQHKIKGFDESSRDILAAAEENTYWVCHGYKGVYKLKIDADYRRVYALDHYTDQNGFSSPFNINVFEWKGQTVFTSNSGIYSFNDNVNRFEPFEKLNSVLDTARNTRKLLVKDNRTWLVQDDQVAFFDGNPPAVTLHNELFLNLRGNLNRGMESLEPLSEGKILIGAITGLYLYNTSAPLASEVAKTDLTGISASDEGKQVHFPLNPQTAGLEFSKAPAILRFDFSSPKLSPSATVQFQYILEGIDNNWSAWDAASFKEYTHLPPGDYVFRVRSRDLLGNRGQETFYPFAIAPIWYQTTWAVAAFILLFFGSAGSAVHLLKRKLKKDHEKSMFASQRTQKLLKLEIEQLRLQQDKDQIKRDKMALEEDNLLKSKELANYTMLLVKKKDIFCEIYNSLKELKRSVKTSSAKKQLQDILLQLNQHRIGEEYMNVFDVNFEKVHRNFFEGLREINPQLTRRELRLLAFVKLDLTNKEISPLLNISVRGVETARYRVRKKLDVQEANLLEFLQQVGVPQEIS